MMAVKLGSGGSVPSSIRCCSADSCCSAAMGRAGQWRMGPRTSPGSSRMRADNRPFELRRSIMFVSTCRRS